MVQEVGHRHVENGAAPAQTLVGNGRRQVSLAAAAGSAQDEPPFGLGGKRSGRLVSAAEFLLIYGVAASALGNQVGESKAGQQAEVAVFLQAFLPFLPRLLPGAAAGNNPSVIRLPRRQERMNDSSPPADRTVRDR